MINITDIQPGLGQQGSVTLNNYPLQLKPGTYKRAPAPRFGDKISTGDLRYQDFNPYESATSISSLEGGYGLRRYSDLLPTTPQPQTYYKESQNVDAREPGIVISPQLTTVTLTGAIANPVWMGEWTPSAGAVTGSNWVIVAGKKIFYLSAVGTSVDSTYALSQNAVQGAVVASGGQLIIGYGSAGTAEYVTTLDASVGKANVTNTTPANLYVFAATADRAAVYIAGGTTSTNNNTVLSAATTAATPPTAFGLAASAVTCGSNDAAITSLVSGGGIVLLFVTKTTELGQIDTSSNYEIIVPFQSRLATNGVGINWWMGGGNVGSPSGPLLLVYPRSRSAWAYVPSTGASFNIAAEGKNAFRPANARGIVTAFQGTSHYLYYSVKTTGGNTWIIANDGMTGANHTYRYNGANNCNAMGITALFGSNPTLYFGYGNNIAYVVLPQDGDYPLDGTGAAVAGYAFDTTWNANTLDLPDIDFGFPDEDKVAISFRAASDSLVPNAQFIGVSYALDGLSTYTVLGYLSTSPFQELQFPTGSSSLVFKRISIRLTFTTTSTTLTPVLIAFSLRASMNPKQYTLWSFEARVPAGLDKSMTQTAIGPRTVVNNFWSTYKQGVAIPYKDRWNDLWNVRLMHFEEIETVWEPGKPPESTLAFQLLEMNFAGSFTWDFTLVWDSGDLWT